MRARPSPRRLLEFRVVDGGSMSVPDGGMRGTRSVRERGFSPEPTISAPPVILQLTHEAALDVVDLADLKRRELELS